MAFPRVLQTSVEGLDHCQPMISKKNPVFQIRICKIRKFLGLLDPDPSIKQKYEEKP
jgi:hypothetical protein